MDGNGHTTEIDFRALAAAMMQREGLAALLGKQFQGARKLYEVLGYKTQLRYMDYKAKYERQDIAGRIVDAPAATTWRNAPEVTEDNNSEDETPFEQAFYEIANRLRLWHYLERVDKLSGIGRYAVLLIGVKGSAPLSAPMPALNGPDDVIYLAAYSEEYAEPTKYETDPTSERFGRPTEYTIDLSGDLAGTTTKRTKEQVHWSRVIHVAEGLLEDEVFGTPRLKGVFNRLDDLEKVVGGSAEMFWQGAYRGPVVKALDGYTIQGGDEEAVQKEVEEYVHGLRRFMRLQGMEADFPTGQSPTPKEVFDILISLIAGKTGIPQRVLLGSERGELASSQDEANWLGRIKERQEHYAEPMILRAFIDRLVEYGAVPPADGGYEVVWPNLFALTELEEAEVIQKKSAALATYANSPAPEVVMPVAEYRTEVLGLKAEPEGGFEAEDELDEDDDEAREQFARGRRAS